MGVLWGCGSAERLTAIDVSVQGGKEGGKK